MKPTKQFAAFDSAPVMLLALAKFLRGEDTSNDALTHLDAALGIPWLPETLLALVKREIAPDFAFGKQHAEAFLAANPDLLLD